MSKVTGRPNVRAMRYVVRFCLEQKQKYIYLGDQTEFQYWSRKLSVAQLNLELAEALS